MWPRIAAGGQALSLRTFCNTMYTGFKHLHSFLAYLVLLAVAAAVIYALLNRSGKRPFAGMGRKLAFFGLIGTHLQFLVGIVLYFVSPLGVSNFSGTAMGDPVQRLYMLEHPLMMMLAVVMVTIGNAKAKRAANDAGKFRAVSLWYGIGLVLMLSRIPWCAWL